MAIVYVPRNPLGAGFFQFCIIGVVLVPLLPLPVIPGLSEIAVNFVVRIGLAVTMLVFIMGNLAVQVQRYLIGPAYVEKLRAAGLKNEADEYEKKTLDYQLKFVPETK